MSDKLYYEQQNVGKSKYVVNYHSVVTKHADGSPFFAIQIFKNKIKKNEFIRHLISLGYKQS